MELSELSKKPELVEIIIDDEETITEFGEQLTFFTYDRQPLDIFLKMATAKQNDPASMINALRPMLLDKNGKPIIKGEEVLPTQLLVKSIAKLVERLGK